MRIAQKSIAIHLIFGQLYNGQSWGRKISTLLYRAFFLDEDDRIFAFHLMECLDDSDAIAQAQDLPAKCSAIEIWEGARVVGRTIRPSRTEVTADPCQIPTSSNTGAVSDKLPQILVSLAMLELQANRRERAACFVEAVYAAFDQADLIIKTSAIEPTGHSSVHARSSPRHAADHE